jgi:ribonucleoside-diphosphate reductase alpha chain
MPDVIQRESTPQQKGLSIERVFTNVSQNKLDDIVYERRTSKITDASGRSVFEKNDVEVPVTWSQVATDVLAQKYFRKKGVPVAFVEKEFFTADDSFENVVTNKENIQSTGENSIKQVAHRLAGTWAWWGHKYGYFKTKADAEAFYDEVKYTLISQIAAPNSPQWFNTGLNWA